MTKFDPWDWLGIECGGFHKNVDAYILAMLEDLQADGEIRSKGHDSLEELICTFLCNTDAFEFDGDPIQLRWVGDDRFKTLDELIEAWDLWYEGHYN